MKLAIILITALLFGTLQCVAGCAMITGDPPCHHDQKSQVTCAHELVLQTPQAIAMIADTLPVSFEAPSMLSEALHATEVIAFSFDRSPAPPLRV
jgi:hypothetical protein